MSKSEIGEVEERIEPLEDLVGERFVDRKDELRWLWEWATSIPQPSNSIALVGRRRTGKTSVLVRLFNQLFYEQERVIPIYITFEEYLDRAEPINSYEFVTEYVTGYIACYLAFRYRQPHLLALKSNIDDLRTVAHQLQDELAIELFDHYDKGMSRPPAPHLGPAGLVQWSIHFPRHQARYRKMPTAIIIDEFQVLTNVYNPTKQKTDSITSGFQKAAETLWAPLLVSGSAVSILVDKALGGGLSGRFSHQYLRSLPRAYTHDLVFRLSTATGSQSNEELAEAIWQMTGGYPYSIESLFQSRCPDRRSFPAKDALEAVTNFELTDSNGRLWQHFSKEFQKYSEQLNDGQTTRRVMFWATKYPDERIDVGRVAKEIGVSEKEVQASLEKLQWVDIVERVGLLSYKGPTDPMLRRFIEYQYHTEIANLAPQEVLKDWQREYRRLRGEVSNFIGHVAEGYIYAIMSGFDGRAVDGEAYFNHDAQVILPHFDKIERRGGVVKTGIPFEMDLIGDWELPNGEGRAAWLVQVKYTKEPVSEQVARKFLNDTETFLAEKGYKSVTRWFFCKQGYRQNAAKFLQQHNVLYSTLEQFNALAKLFDFFGLPK